MSKRLQVLMDEQEYNLFKKQAKRANLSVGEWVRQMLRKSASQTSHRSGEEKLRMLARAYEHSFPTADIDEMLAEIEKGYTEGSAD